MVGRIEKGLELLSLIDEHIWYVAVNNAISKPAFLANQLFLGFIILQVAFAFRARENF